MNTECDPLFQPYLPRQLVAQLMGFRRTFKIISMEIEKQKAVKTKPPIKLATSLGEALVGHCPSSENLWSSSQGHTGSRKDEACPVG